MSGAPPRFVLVRHGEASGNREMRYLGATDAPLPERGQAEARQLPSALALYRPAALYTSPLLRARQTAQAVAAVLGLAVVADPRLREEDFGAWENRTRAEVQAADPQRLAAWEAGATIAPPGGESLAAVRERGAEGADALARGHSGRTGLLATQVGPLQARAPGAVSAMKEMPTFEHQASQPEPAGRRGTWPRGVPPLRLNRPLMRPSLHPAQGEPAELDASLASRLVRPRGLRLLRALVGIALLALAWGGFVVVANLGDMALGALTSARPSAHLLLYLAVALGTLWIAAVAICCIIAGAFSLTLAVVDASFE